MEFQKYSGDIKFSGIVKYLKRFHNMVKKYFIDKYSNNINILIDVGSGRGSDARYWVQNRIKFAIGIEPSNDSIKQAIRNYIKLQNMNKGKKITRIQYLNGQGQKNWSDGYAALKEDHIEKFKRYFGNRYGKDKSSIQADNINLFWTIHYMMDTEEDFNMLMDNIDRHTHIGSTVTILCMNGQKIDGLLKKNKGSIVIKNTNNQQLVFQLDAKYDYKTPINKLPKYGNKISVLLAATYGLQKGIEENLVFTDHLVNEFKKKGFELILEQDFLDVKIPELDKLRDYERKVSDLYIALVFKKK
jgi:hypothetical protein